MLLLVGGLLLICGLFVFLALLSLNPTGREQAVAQAANFGVAEFVQLPGEDAYPAALAVAADGTLYTASYVTGAVWAITPDGQLNEIAGTREALGSVTGMAVGADGTLYVVDQLSADIRAAGGIVRRISGLPDNPAISDFAQIGDARGFVEPADIVLDAQGFVYVSDRGRGEIWRFDADGTNGALWWAETALVAGVLPAPSGMAFDAQNNALIVVDGDANAVYRLRTADTSQEVLYLHGGRANPPGFNGVTVAADGRVYVAMLGTRAVGYLTASTDTALQGDLAVVAGPFRGASDVAYVSVPDPRLYVTNFDQVGLVLPGIRPQLPFALDVIYPTGTP